MPNMNDDISGRIGKLQGNGFFTQLFRNMIDGFAYHKMLFDSDGKAVDYVFLEVNEAFEHLTGLKRETILGKKVTEVLPGIANDPANWIGTYGRVAVTGESVRFENYSQMLDKWFSVSAFSPEKGYFIATFEDITARKKAEQVLRENEWQIRSKLNSILSPVADIGEQELSNIIDVPKLQAIMDDMYTVTKVGFSIVDLKGKVLVRTGWQDICTHFHRVNPQTLQNCIESDLTLTKDVRQGEFRTYKCKNNLWDIVTPLIIGGKHVGNIFSGQFFFEDETINRDIFVAQAEKYGFNKEMYLAAFDKVPRWSREKVHQLMQFYTKFSEMIAAQSYSNLKIAKALTNQKAVEKELRESEQRLSRSQEIAHLGSWELNLVTNSLYWSDEVYRIFGLKPQEFGATYEAFLEAVHPEDRAAVDGAYSRSLREGKDVYEIEHRIVRKTTGEIRFVHEKCYHIRNETGQIIRSIGMVHDITERKLMEDALRESEQRWATTLSSIGDAVISTDAAGKVTFMNAVAEMLTGWTFSEALQKPIQSVFKIINEYSRKQVENPVVQVLEKGLVVGLANHTLLVRKDGSTVAIDDSGAPIIGKNGKITGAVLIFRDITGRKQVEQALERAKADWERTFDSVPDLIAILDSKHKIMRVNKAMANTLGTTPEKCVGLSCYKCVHGTDKPPAFCPHVKTLEDGKEHIEEVHEERLGGDFIVSTTPLTDEHGHMMGSVHMARNITMRKQMEKKLEEHTVHLEELVKDRTQQLRDAERLAAIGETAGMVGHDLRNPLQTLTGEVYLAKAELEALPGSPTKANLTESIRAIAEQVTYMNKIVSDLQDFVRPITPNAEPVNLQKLLLSTLAEVDTPKNIEIDTQIDWVLPDIKADGQLLKRVFINLATNAMQAMPNGGRLTVKMQKRKIANGNETMLICIEDTGIGIVEDIKPKIFKPLFTTKSKGQGFGLAVCRRVIEAHGGTISFESQQGNGTTFIIELPNENNPNSN